MALKDSFTAAITGTKIPASVNTPVALAASQRCKGVWIGPKKNATTKAVNNASPICVGVGGAVIPLDTTNSSGIDLGVDDPSKVLVESVGSGDGVDYMIYV